MRASKVGTFNGTFGGGYPLLDCADNLIAYVWDEVTANGYVEKGALMRLLIRVGALSLPVTVRQVMVDEIIPLRHKVLRPGLPVETASFKYDDLPDTRHFALFSTDACLADPTKPLCCGTFVRKEYGKLPAFQLRGMATETSYQGCGLGAELLRVAEETITQITEARIFWCNARLAAVSFYKRAGWKDDSEDFEMPGVGPHRIMVKGGP